MSIELVAALSAKATESRIALALGDSATLDVGATTETVAAGDDSRIINAVPSTRQVVAGTGLTGGGALSSDVTVSLSLASQTSLELANTAIQDGSNALIPNGGTSGQVLVKNSSLNRDVSWVNNAATAAVSYASQTLTAMQQTQARTNISAALKGHIYGLTLANNATDATNDIDIAVGEAASDSSQPLLMVLASAIKKQVDASWTVGTGGGGLDTGTVTNTGTVTYHIFLIYNSNLGVTDALFSLSSTAPTMPSGYDHKRRIGSILRTSGVNVAFTQVGNRFYKTNYSVDRNSAAAASNVLLSLVVPTGIQVRPILSGSATNSSGNSSATVGNGFDTMSSIGLFAINGTSSASFWSEAVFTNTSGQIRYSATTSGALSVSQLNTYGWVDTRGAE